MRNLDAFAARGLATGPARFARSRRTPSVHGSEWRLGRVTSGSRHQRHLGGASNAIVPSHVGWGRATTLLSVLLVRHGSLDSTPAQDSVSSLGGLREEAALWEKFSSANHPTRTRCFFETLGLPPVLGHREKTKPAPRDDAMQRCLLSLYRRRGTRQRNPLSGARAAAFLAPSAAQENNHEHHILYTIIFLY
jgi:hypothetical protein